MKIRIIRIPDQYKYGGELNARKWKHEGGGPLDSLVTDINRRSNADFVKRLQDPKRDYIQDWATDNIATHKLSWATDDNGAIVFPNVQRINGKLYDFTDPINNRGEWDALDSAIERGDTLRMTPSQAKEFTETYKKYYPKGKTFRAEGGPLLTQGGIWSNGVTFIDNGGTHEQNPNEGVQIGVDQQGVPNLVEQGEVIYNDYVFSNRIKLPESIKKKYKLKGDTFADAAKYAQLESQERPNDPISKRGLEANMSRLAEAQEGIKNRRGKGDTNKFEYGGPYKTYKNFTPIQDDWYTGDYMNFVNFLQEGEPSSLNWLKRINSQEFGPIGGNTFTDISDIKRLATDRKKGPVHNAMQAASRTYKRENTPLSEPVAPSFNIPTPPVPKSISPQSPISSGDEDDSGRRERASWLRYAPIVGAGIGAITDMFSRPDYENADLVLNSTKNLGNVDFTPIGNYLSYQPFDRNYYINRLDASANATRRGLQNTSGGNRANMQAGLLAADYNYGQNLGDLARKAEEYNLAQRQQVEGFNRGTNQFNSEGAMRAAMANNQNDELRMRAAMSAAQLRQAIKDQDSARRSANITNFLQGLGDIGWEQEQASWLDRLADAGVLQMDTRGNYSGKKKSKGGKLKKKKGFTYG